MAEETKNTKPADEEIEKTAEPTAGEEKQPETEKAESDTAAAKEEQPEKKGFFGKKKEKKYDWENNRNHQLNYFAKSRNSKDSQFKVGKSHLSGGWENLCFRKSHTSPLDSPSG